jgi:hypothetical protein
MKRNVAIGILRAWIAFGIICVPIIATYIEEQTSGPRRGGDGFSAFIFGCIVVVVGFFLLRWVISAFTNGRLNLSKAESADKCFGYTLFALRYSC